MRCTILIFLAFAGVIGSPEAMHGQVSGRRAINPPSLPPPRGYSHVVVAPVGRLVSISGQVAVDSLGQVVGAGDFRAQCVQVFENLGRALRSAGASWSDVVATNMYVTDLGQLDVLREVRSRYLPADGPPASTLVQVVGLVRPELMIEVAVEAVLPAAGR
ncbi:MAG: RidA family protein [Gemmatimonadales bacterium]